MHGYSTSISVTCHTFLFRIDLYLLTEFNLCEFLTKFISSYYSWFAGYMTESEAKQKLLNHEGGAFLVRFNTSMVSPGFVLSTKSHSNDFVEYNIEASFSVIII